MTVTDPITVDVDAVVAHVRDNMAETYDLTYVSYDDQLTDEQIAHIFATGTDDDSYFQFEDEQRHHYAVEALEQLVPDTLEYAALNRSDAWYELIDEIKERDNSSTFDGLLRNTHRKLLRYSIAGGDEDEPDLDSGSWSWDEEEIRVAARRLADRIPGVDFTFLPQLRELVVNATYGGDLYVIWYGDVDDFVQASFDDSVERTVTWTDPEILVLDRWNGSGHEVTFKGLTLTLPWNRERLVLDDKDAGYGWDQVCGLHKPAYEADPVLTPRPERG